MTRYWLKGTGVLVVLAGFVVGLSRSAEAQMPDVPATAAGAFDARSFLPWPPAIPDPHPFLPVPPPGTPPFLPPIGPADADWWTTASDPPPVLQDLARFIATLERTRDLLARWAGDIQRAASNALARMVWESPGHLPQGMEPPDLVGQIMLLPRELRGALETLLAKLRAPVRSGSSDARHQMYTERSPGLAREAARIVATDQVVTTGAVQQEAAVHTTSRAASAVARDGRLPAAIEAGHRAGEMLLDGAQSLPSTRAGVELLVAGMGMEMRQQTDLGEAVADRLTVLAQQTAEVSQQIGTLAATAGALTARAAERDRQALDARLGLADAIGAGVDMLQQMLAGTGEPVGDEVRLDPLY